jgi:hypothetical protein
VGWGGVVGFAFTTKSFFGNNMGKFIVEKLKKVICKSASQQSISVLFLLFLPALGSSHQDFCGR